MNTQLAANSKSDYVVAKFGGTSVANFDAMSRCAEIVCADNQVRVVAVSASAGVTNHLVALCKGDLSAAQRDEHITGVIAIQENILAELSLDADLAHGFDETLKAFQTLAAAGAKSAAEQDELLSFGERLSSYLFTQVLRGQGLDAVRFDVRKVLKTDSQFAKATPNIAATAAAAQKHLVPLLAEQVVVTQGFIGSDEHNQTTTLGRGGSDYSAALLAEAINAKITTTDFISQVDAPEVLMTPAVMQAILSPEVKEDGLNSEVIEVAPEHVIVVRVEETRDETVLPLAEVKDQVVAALSAVQAEQQAVELGVSLVNELEQGNEAVLADNNLEFTELETIDRNSPLAASVFALAKPEAGQAVFGQSKDQDGNIVVVELSKVTAEINPAYSTQIGAQLERVGNQQDVTNVLNVLRKNADGEYYVVGQGQ